MGPARRYPFLLASIGGLLLCLSVAPGCCKRCCGKGGNTAQVDNTLKSGSTGVTVTSPVPHAGTTGTLTDNTSVAPSSLSAPRAIPIGKRPPPIVIPPAEESR